MEQKRTGLSYVFTLAKEERGKLSLGMLLAVFSSALSFVPYLVVYQILLLIIKQEVTLPAMLGWAGIGIAAAVLQAILTSFAGICSHTAAFNTMHRIKVRVLEHMSKFNLGFFQEHAPGQIKTTLFDDVDRIETFLAHQLPDFVSTLVMLLTMFIIMFSSDDVHFHAAAELDYGAYHAGSYDLGDCNSDGPHGALPGFDGRVCRRYGKAERFRK